jgi:putative transposase
MARKPRIVQTEFPYHLTARTNNKTFRFQNRKAAILLIARALDETRQRYGLAIRHFILMSNHFHLVAALSEENLSRAMQYLLSRVALRYNRLHHRSGHLWGDRFRSTIIATDHSYLRVVRYLYQNPVRAKMVDKPSDHDACTFSFYAFGLAGEVKVDGDHLLVVEEGNQETLKRKRLFFIELVDGPLSEYESNYIQTALMGLFFGPPHFLQQMRARYLAA